MDRSGGGILTLTLILAVWAGSGQIRSAEPTRPSSSSAMKTQSAAIQQANHASKHGSRDTDLKPTDDGYRDQRQLLVATMNEALTTKLSADKAKELKHSLAVFTPESGKLGFMIVLVPNPVRTHLSLLFDRTVDSVQQAMQDACFDFDRALLPWDNQQHPDPDSYLLRAGEDYYRRRAEMVPGVLIFRYHRQAALASAYPESGTRRTCKAVPPVDDVFVFLVADTPTGGIDRTQFEVALQIGKSVTKSPSSNLLVMGPSFSGSLPSLHEILKVHGGEFQQTTIVSGSITSRDSVDTFQDAFQKDPEAPSVNFATFQENDRSTLYTLYDYACAKWKMRPSEVAVISETETAYGRQSTTPVPDSLCVGVAGAENRTPASLFFPRGIYHLRTAYEQQKVTSGDGADAATPTHTSLRPNLGESRSSADAVPEFSLQSPISQDAVLMGVVDELHRRKSQMVVLIASDSLDSLFLVRYLRKNYAYGRLVLLSPDLLLRHESDQPDMHGILTLSPYSLRPGEDAEILHASGRNVQGITFPDDGEKAIYNATRVLAFCLERPRDAWCTRPMSARGSTADGFSLSEKLYLHDYGPSVLEDASSSYLLSRPVSTDLHLDALGRDGYWPVAVISPGSESWLPKQQHANSIQPHGPSVPATWKAVVVIVLGCFGLAAICLYGASLLGSFEPEILLAPAGLDSSRGVKRIYLIAFVYACWTGLLALVLWPAAFEEFGSEMLIRWGSIGLGFSLYSWFVWVAIKRYKRAFWSVHIVILSVVIISFRISSMSGFRIFLLRYVNVSSGISPLVPLVLVILSLAWWAWYSVAGSVLTDIRRPLLPSSEGGRNAVRPALPELLAAIGAEEQGRLERVMVPGSFDKRVWIPVLAALVAASLLIFPSRAVRSLEHFSYDYLMMGLFVFAFVLLLESMARGLMVWTDAKRLLRAIDGQPFSTMISRRDGFSWTAIWKFGAGSLESAHQLLLPEIEALQVVQNRVPATLKMPQLFPETEMKNVWGRYLDLLAKRRSRFSQESQGVTASGGQSQDQQEQTLLENFGQLQHRLADAAAVLLTYLHEGYAKHPRHECGTPDKDALKALRSKPLQSFEEFAEHYVSLVYVNYIVTILLRIRTLAMAAVGIFVLNVLAISSYAFEPRAILRTLMFTVFLVMTASFGFVYAQMHRDRALSRITETAPEKLGADFWFRMLGVTGLPLLSLLATEFPSIGNWAFSWFEPAVRALR